MSVSMFYVKSRGRKIYLRDDNVYTRCPGCGKEHAIDISDIAETADPFDLYDTSVYCEECSEV